METLRNLPSMGPQEQQEHHDQKPEPKPQSKLVLNQSTTTKNNNTNINVVYTELKHHLQNTETLRNPPFMVSQDQQEHLHQERKPYPKLVSSLGRNPNPEQRDTTIQGVKRVWPQSTETLNFCAEKAYLMKLSAFCSPWTPVEKSLWTPKKSIIYSWIAALTRNY